MKCSRKCKNEAVIGSRMCAYHRDKNCEWMRQWRVRNIDKKRQYERDWYAKNKEVKRRIDYKSRYGKEAPGHATTQFYKQKGLCGICEKPIEIRVGTHRESAAHLDHNHITNQLRGILCQQCNRALGQFYEDKGILLRAIAYLEEWETKYAVGQAVKEVV